MYLDVPPNLKRCYLKFFFEAIYVEGKKISEVVETLIFTTLRRQHHIITRSNWLPLKDLFCNHKLEFDISLSDLKIAFDEIGLKQPKLALATI